jgi:hypothetical protein
MASIWQEFLSVRENAKVWNDDKHPMYKMDSDKFAKLEIKTWKHNRPHDEDRVREIHADMLESHRVDGIIYLAHTSDGLVCYDGNHRRLALKGVEGVDRILLDVMWGVDDEVIKQEFVRLNKAMPVPELYTVEPVVSVTDLQSVFQQFYKKYKLNKVTSLSPQRPNFNETMITNQFTDAVKALKITPNELLRRLYVLNETMEARDRSKLSQTVIDRCIKGGCWIFAWNTVLIHADIEKV